jgi:hypothetical protein
MTTQILHKPSKSTTAYQESDGNHSHGLLATVIREIQALDDWLAGPPMTERERMSLVLAEAENVRRVGPQAW